MKKQFSDDVTFELLIQYIEETADAAQKQSVEDWLSADSQHRIFFKRIKEAWSNPNDIKELGKSNIDKDWSLIQKRIKKGKTVIRSKNIHLASEKWYQQKWLRIAAIFIIIVALAEGVFIIQRPQPVARGQMVFNEIKIPFGQKSQLVLSDGTKIWINAGSKLRFPNYFGSKIREVWLDGEAFFEIAKDPSKPFYVRTSDLSIKALGTSFNVKAYDDEGIIETTLVSGQISIEKNNAKGKEEVILVPYHKAIYIKNESSRIVVAEDTKQHITEPLKPRKIIVSQPVKLEPIISWTEDKLVFENEPFENIAKQLERRYGMLIIIENEELKQYRYTGILKKITVEQAIKAIQLTAKFNYTVQDNKITITNTESLNKKTLNE